MPLVALTLALAAGIYAGSLLWGDGLLSCDVSLFLALHASSWPRLVLGSSAVLALPLLWRWPRGRRAGVVLYALLGVALYLARPASPCLPAGHIGTVAAAFGEQGRTVAVTGVIADWPEARANQIRYRVRVEAIHTRGQWQPAAGTLLLTAAPYPAFSYGDRVRAVGRLALPPVFKTFDYRAYLARQGIHAVMRAERVLPLEAELGSPFWHWLYGVRARASRVINLTLPEPYASLANGILLGIESSIPRDLYDDFNATGTSHIIVISGFNIAIVMGLFLAVLGPWLGRRRAAAVAIVGVALYVLLVGADAAVVRAGIMGGLYAAAMALRRQTQVLNTLCASALLMLVANPLTLWDLGFQLSFLATLGLILLVPLLQRPFRRALARYVPDSWQSPALSLLNEAVIVTLAAQVATTPLIVATFGRVSLVSLLTNALILPVQPLIMVGAGISTLAGFLYLPLGQLLALVPLIPLAWTVAMVEVTARWPGAGVEVPAAFMALARGYYPALALFLLWWYRWRPRGHRVRLPVALGPGRRVNIAARGGLLVGALALVLWSGTRAPLVSARLSLYPGGHVMVRAPQVGDVLLPARGARGRFPNLPASQEPAIWILTHTDVTTLTALRLHLQASSPRAVFYPAYCVGGRPCPEAMRLFLTLLDREEIPRAALAPGQPLSLGPYLKVRYLPGAAASSPVHPLLLTYGATTVLLPADLPPALQATLRPDTAVVLMPLPPAGSGAWPLPEFLTAVRPRYLLLPRGATYPPASTRALASFPHLTYDEAAPLHLTLPPAAPLELPLSQQ